MKAKKTSKAAESVAAGRGKKRKRLSGVRGRVLELLGSGPMSSAELVAAGGFSAASLYLNLKSLKKDGLVDTRRDGRRVIITLVAGASAPAAPAARTSRTARTSAPAAVPAYVPRDLAQALESLSHRLSPIARLDDKLLVLQQLSRSLQHPVAGLLQDIVTDLKRIGSAST
jgi:DNA-binding transcriptional ArsR family regulator